MPLPGSTLSGGAGRCALDWAAQLTARVYLSSRPLSPVADAIQAFRDSAGTRTEQPTRIDGIAPLEIKPYALVRQIPSVSATSDGLRSKRSISPSFCRNDN